jgi:subtilase family serine protease
VSALSAPATAAPGGSIVISDTTANRGQGAAGSSTTRFVLSTNFAIDAADVTLGSRAIASLAGGASSAGSTLATIPATVAPGSYYLLTAADADLAVLESNEGNNTAWVLLRVGPDLVVSSLSAPSGAGAGASIAVTDTTTNQGAAGAGPSRTRFFLSTNVLLDGGDTLLSASRSIGALSAGTGSAGTTTVVLPSGLAAGQYFLLAEADGDNAVVESSETNNVKYTPVRIGPDLVPTALTAPTSAGAGSTIAVTDTLANQGGGDAAASTTRFYLSANSLLDASDVVLNGARAVPGLAAGATSSGSTLVQIPASTPTGRHYLLAVADADGVVAETSESNNVRYVTLTVGGDLVVSSLSGPSAAGAGSSITVTDTTTNQGGNAVSTSTTRYYLSTDPLHSPNDVALVGGRTVPALGTGVSSTGSAVVNVPAGVASGFYYLIAKADADLVVEESDETNNTRYSTVTLGPDLVISSFTAPAKAGAGLTISVTDSTRNQGGGAAGASVTRFYLSLDWMLDVTDVALVDSRSVPTLNAGALSTGTTTLTIPGATQTGAYFLIAEADGGRTVTEANEGNNTRYGSIRIGPDLVVTSISAPTSVAVGSTITATDTTMNQGGGAAGASVTRYYLSTDAFFGSGDIPLGSGRPVGSLAPNGTSVGSAGLTIPAGTTPGLYYLIARSDDGNVVVETFETNNTWFRSIQVLAP